MNRWYTWLAVFLVLLQIGACASYRRQSPPGELSTGTVNDLDVLTRDGTIYQFAEARVDSLTIDGLGFAYAAADTVGAAFAGSVPLADVVLVQTRHREPLSVIMTMTATIAVAAIVASTGDASQEGTVSYYAPGSGYWGSCPFVYVHDGEDYRLEGEPFVGSICRELQQTTLTVLPHLVEGHGTLSVALCNQARESQYVDHVRLLAVDHPAGTHLAAGAFTGLHVVSDAAPPAVVRDADGRDVTGLLAAADGRCWSSDLARIDTDDDATLVDEVVCSFPLPAAGTDAELVVELVNSDLAEFAVHKLLALCGEDRMGWYRDLAGNPAQRQLLLGWMLREGCLAVDVWDGNEWRRQGLVPQVGGAVSVARVVPVMVPSSEGDELRVRLRGTTGMWRLDAVALDPIRSAPPPVEAVAMISFDAVSPDLQPGMIRQPDGSYLPLYPEDWVLLQYAAPAAPAAAARTYVLEAGGHYYHWPDGSAGAGRRDLVQRILAEPLLGSRLFLDEWVTHHRDIPSPQPPPALPHPDQGPLTLAD